MFGACINKSRTVLSMKFKKIYAFTIILSLISVPVSAAETPFVKTEIFNSEVSEAKYNFAQEIEENNKKYELGQVTYKILSETPKTETVHQTDTIIIKDLYTKKFDLNDENSISEIPKTRSITVDGKNYILPLEKITYKDITISNRTADVSTTLMLTEAEIKNEIEYEYNDTQVGQKVTVTLHQNSISETDEVKENSVSFSVVFHRYDSEEFIINNRLVPVLKESSVPVDKEFFSDIKAESDYADSNGEITDIQWEGDEYLSGGEMCRNAIATLTGTEKIYAVKYSDTVSLPNADGYQAIISYGKDIEKSTDQFDYEIEATAEYYPVNTDISPLFIGIGVLITALLIAVVLVIIVKKKKLNKTNSEVNYHETF